MQAIIAIPTIFLLILFTKVCQQHTTTTKSTFAIIHNLLDLLASYTTFLLISFLSNRKFQFCAVCILIKENTLCFQSITSSSSRLLIVSLQAFGHIIVNDGTNI